jgi:hypothetical protein
MRTNEELNKKLKLPMTHISDMYDCFELCRTEDDIDAVLGRIPRIFGSVTVDYSGGDMFTVIVTYDDDSEKVDFYLEDEEDEIDESENPYPINEAHEEYYKFLEAINKTGVRNMLDAHIFLVECFKITELEAKNILYTWMKNYDLLCELYGWQV